MKNKKIILLSLLLISCTPAVNTPVTPSTNPSISALPSNQASINPVPTQSVTNSVVPTTSSNPIVSSTPTSVPTANPNNTDELLSTDGLIQLNSAYLKTPDTAFLVNNNINMKVKMSFDILPSANQTITLFDVYDNNSSPKKSHFSLSLSQNKLNLKALNDSENIDNSVDLPNIVVNKAYEISFIKTDKKIDILLNNRNILSVDFDGADFNDISGTRTLNVGANLSGENKLTGKIDYIRVDNVLVYEFKQNLSDQNKYNLTPVVFGNYQLITPIITEPSSSPTPIFSPTPTPSSIIAPERNVTDKTGSYLMNLNVYDSEDNTQYYDCQQRGEERQKDNKNYYFDCKDETGLFNSSGFDFGTANSIVNDNADIRFVTDVFENNISRIRIAGNGSSPIVNVIDMGSKSFEQINTDFLINKVDYTNNKKLFSDSNIASNVIVDHVYAIKTYRYGKEPRYAKVIIDEIITNDSEFIQIRSPEIVSAPQYVTSNGNSILSPTKSYSYYVSSYDGNNETAAALAGEVLPDENSNISQVKLTIKVPYAAKGYALYRKDNETQKIYKIGPTLSKIEQDIDVYDNGDKGVLVSSLPSSNNTKNGFKPDQDSKAVKVNFRYFFDGDGK